MDEQTNSDVRQIPRTITSAGLIDKHFLKLRKAYFWRHQVSKSFIRCTWYNIRSFGHFVLKVWCEFENHRKEKKLPLTEVKQQNLL